ncbi:MAG: ABC transporter permease subunit [Anaerolineales bacterium]|nr:ABC transporter permease subunit [Anaerolineales bacterium]
MLDHIWPIIKKEYKDSIRNRWLVTFTIVSFLLVIGLPFLVAFGLGLMAPQMTQLVAGTTEVVYPLLPLIALPIGSAAIVGERDKHTMELLLAQPISRATIFLGKYIGMYLAVASSITLGMGAAVLVVAEAPTMEFYIILAIAFVLTAIMLGIAFIISAMSKERTMALGMALFVWFFFAVFVEMGFISMLIAASQQQPLILVSVIAGNPLEVAKLLAGYLTLIDVTQMNPIMIGAEGMAIIKVGGVDLVFPFLWSSILTWFLIPTVAAFIIFLRKDL